jgi:hypothetical protein
MLTFRRDETGRFSIQSSIHHDSRMRIDPDSALTGPA